MSDDPEDDERVHVVHFPPDHTLCGEVIEADTVVVRLYDDQPSLDEGCWPCMVRRRELTGKGDVP